MEYSFDELVDFIRVQVFRANNNRFITVLVLLLVEEMPLV